MTGQKDEYENELSEKVYEGPCSYQKGGQTSLSSIVARNDVVYLPQNDVLIEANDVVEATNFKGRKEYGVVKVVRDIQLPLNGMQFTRLELKQATGE